MADRFFGIEFGEMDAANVLEGGSSTAAKDVEVRITYDAANNSRTAALAALEVIKRYIMQDTWPPV